MLIPQPPMDLPIDKQAELVITSSLAVIAVLGVCYALYHWARSGRPVMLLLFFAGGLMMVFEPLVDTVGACWFSKDSWIAFEAWGRPLPVWLCLAYFFYFGIASSMFWLALKRGMSSTQIWISLFSAMIGDLLFESALLTVDPYTYYGNQPMLLPNGFPLWWMTVNATIPMVLGAIVYKFDDFFRGLRALTIIPLGLAVSSAVNSAVGWPSWTVINTDFGWVATQLGGVLSFVFCFCIVKLITVAVASDTQYKPMPTGRAVAA